MTAYKTLAIVDDVHTCDCCGKSNLKQTVAMERDDGEILHFGSVCATRHSGRSAATIGQEARAAIAEKKAAAEREYLFSPEFSTYEVRMAQARHAGLIGKPFADFCRDARMAASAARERINSRYGI